MEIEKIYLIVSNLKKTFFTSLYLVIVTNSNSRVSVEKKIIGLFVTLYQTIMDVRKNQFQIKLSKLRNQDLAAIEVYCSKLVRMYRLSSFWSFTKMKSSFAWL